MLSRSSWWVKQVRHKPFFQKCRYFCDSRQRCWTGIQVWRHERGGLYAALDCLFKYPFVFYWRNVKCQKFVVIYPQLLRFAFKETTAQERCAKMWNQWITLNCCSYATPTTREHAWHFIAWKCWFVFAMVGVKLHDTSLRKGKPSGLCTKSCDTVGSGIRKDLAKSYHPAAAFFLSTLQFNPLQKSCTFSPDLYHPQLRANYLTRPLTRYIHQTLQCQGYLSEGEQMGVARWMRDSQTFPG